MHLLRFEMVYYMLDLDLWRRSHDCFNLGKNGQRVEIVAANVCWAREEDKNLDNMDSRIRGFYEKIWVLEGVSSSAIVEEVFPNFVTNMTQTVACIIGTKGAKTKMWGSGRRCSYKDWTSSSIWSISLWWGFRGAYKHILPSLSRISSSPLRISYFIFPWKKIVTFNKSYILQMLWEHFSKIPKDFHIFLTSNFKRKK